MGLELTILGSNSARPAYGRFTTSQYLNVGSQAFLIDAGEGFQLQLNKFGLKPNRIQNIFISHLHGDHILGLPGFLNSLNLGGRTKPMTIYSPPGLKEWFTLFQELSTGHLSYPLEFIDLTSNSSQVVLQTEEIKVTAFPVEHRIPTYGFRFDESLKEFNIDPDKIKALDLTITEIKEIKSGMDIIREGKRIPFQDIVFPRKPSKSYAYCADTNYTDLFLDLIKNVDLLYHEATYLKDMTEQARERKHSTAEEAAKIATMARAKKLLIGHFSSRYKDLQPLLAEAKEIFQNTYLALDGDKHLI